MKMTLHPKNLSMAAISLQLGFGVIATTAVTVDSALARPKAEAVKQHEIRRKRPVASATDTNVRSILPFNVSKGTASSFGLSNSAGEIQSIIVPPGKKAQCPAGRILVSDDAAKTPGLIEGHDLDSLGTSAISVTPEPLSDMANTRICSNDHDLIVLDNGDVVLMKMGQSRVTLKPKPGWFDSTFREIATGICQGIWGPGARSATFVWRSEDCGENFVLQDDPIDVALLDDGWNVPDDNSGGLPQKAFVASDGRPLLSMGGTDGPRATVDPKTGRIFYTVKIAGFRNKLGDDVTGFEQSSARVQRSVVMMSSDRGTSWTEALTIPFSGWRIHAVPLDNNELLLFPGDELGCRAPLDTTADCQVLYAAQIGANLGTRPVDDNGDPENGDDGTLLLFGPNMGWPSENDASLKNTFDAAKAASLMIRVQPSRILVRSPDSSGQILVTADIIDGGQGGFGYHMRFNGYPNQWSQELKPIKPLEPSPNNFIMNPSAIDIGKGPIFIYWYDVNTDKGSAQVRGRIIVSDNQHSADFSISNSFPLPTSGAMWFGDYMTAGGYHKLGRPVAQALGQPSRASSNSDQSYEFFPVWKQSDNNIYTVNISFRQPAAGSASRFEQFKRKARVKTFKKPIDPSLVQPGERYEK